MVNLFSLGSSQEKEGSDTINTKIKIIFLINLF